MTVNPEALKSPVYNPDYVGLTMDIYKYYTPVTQQDLMDLKLALNDYTRINKYEGVLYNPRLAQIDYAESLIDYNREDITDLDKILYDYYFNTDFSCNPNVTKPCTCPTGMKFNDIARTCTGPIQDPPLKQYTYNSVVPVSVPGKAWHSLLNQFGIWVSKDGSTPFQMTDTYVSVITSFVVPTAGNYALEAGADFLGHFFLNGVLTVSTNDPTSWTSQKVSLQPGTIYIEARVQNNSNSTSYESWSQNPGGIGFRIIAPDGSVVITSHDRSVKAVPFLCADGTISNLDQGTCTHDGTIPCVIENPITNPLTADWDYWVSMKGPDLRKSLSIFYPPYTGQEKAAWGPFLGNNSIWASSDGTNPWPNGDPDCVIINTTLNAPQDDTYEFQVAVDDATNFYIDDNLVISSGNNQGSYDVFPVQISMGSHKLEISIKNVGAWSDATNPAGMAFSVFLHGVVIFNSRDYDTTKEPLSTGPKLFITQLPMFEGTWPNTYKVQQSSATGSSNTSAHVLRLPFQSELDQVDAVLEKFKDWTNMETANFTSLLGLASHDEGMRARFQGLDNACDCEQNYLGSLKQEGEDLMTQLINILLGFAQYIAQIKALVAQALKGYIAPNPPPPCIVIDFSKSPLWSMVSGILFYNGKQAVPADLSNGTLFFSDGSEWDAAQYLKANPNVQEAINKGLPLFPNPQEYDPLITPSYPDDVAVGSGYGVWVSTDGISPVYAQAMNKWVSLGWSFDVTTSGTYSVNTAEIDQMNVYIDDFSTPILQQLIPLQRYDPQPFPQWSTYFNSIAVWASSDGTNPWPNGDPDCVIIKTTMYVTTAGTYEFKVAADDYANFYIDGSLAFSTGQNFNSDPDVHDITLAVGNHSLEISFKNNGPGWSSGNPAAVSVELYFNNDQIFTTRDYNGHDNSGTVITDIPMYQGIWPLTYVYSTASSGTIDLTVGTHNILTEGWHNQPPVLSNPVNDPAYMSVAIYDPSGSMFWNTRSGPPSPCLCETGYSPDPSTNKCVKGGKWGAGDHFIQIGAAAGLCMKPPCPYLIPEDTLTPIFKAMQAASGDQLLKVLNAITQRMAMELNNLTQAIINLDRISVANLVNNLPDDACGKQFVNQVLQPSVASILFVKNAQRHILVPKLPVDKLIPINAAPKWNL